MPSSQENVKSIEEQTFLKVNVLDWVCNTAKRVKKSEEWNDVWTKVYKEIGGEKPDTSGSKVCPRSGAKTLWFLGMLKCTDRPLLEWSYSQIKKELSKNGVYAVLTIDILKINSDLSSDEVWIWVRKLFKRIFPGIGIPLRDEGASIVAFKLLKNGYIK